MVLTLVVLALELVALALDDMVLITSPAEYKKLILKILALVFTPRYCYLNSVRIEFCSVSAESSW